MLTTPVPTDRILRLTSGSTAVTLQGTDGEPQDASGSVVASATRLDGSVAFTSRSTTHGTTGVYSVNVNGADTADLDTLRVAWYDAGSLRAYSTVEIVGGFYFTVAEVRAADTALAQSSSVPDARIKLYRNVVEWECERICGVAFVPRARLAVIDSPESRVGLYMPDPMVRDVRLLRAWNGPNSDPTDYTGDDLDDLTGTEAGQIVSRSGAWSFPAFRNGLSDLAVLYEHGFDAPPPDVKDAAILHLRSRITRRTGSLPDRAMTQTNEFGTVTLATAGRDGFETGLPDVDAVYARHDFRTPGMA